MPGTESQAAADLLADRFPSESASTARIVFTTSDGSSLDEPLYAEAIGTMLEDLAPRPGVAEVAAPFESGSISADASIAYADVTYAMPVEEVPLSERSEEPPSELQSPMTLSYAVIVLKKTN